MKSRKATLKKKICKKSNPYNKRGLRKGIKKYGVNQIHEACDDLGHTTNWTSFDRELRTYNKDDLKSLKRQLKRNN